MVGDFLMGSFPVRGSYSIAILEKILIDRSAYQVRKILSIWCSCVIEQSQYGNPCHNLDSTQAYEVAHMMIEWPPTYKQLLFFCHLSYPLCLENSSCFFYIFSSLCLLSSCCFLYQISPHLSSPLFCRWWNCPSPYIIWNMSWWSRTYEELGIISSRPYITFSSFSVMMPWCSKFKIRWWLTCFWGLYYCYYLFFIYIIVL